MRLIFIAVILAWMVWLSSCTHEETLTGPVSPENVPIIVRTPVTYSMTVKGNRYTCDQSDTVSYFSRTFLLSLSVTGGSAGLGFVTVVDSAGSVIRRDSLFSNLIVVDQKIVASMPLRVSLSLRNFTGSLSLMIVFREPDGDIMPLAVGNQWTYVSTSYAMPVPDTVFYEITQQIPVAFRGNAVLASVERSYKHSGPRPFQWLQWKGPDGIYTLGGISETDTVLTDILHLKFPATKGDTWQVPNLGYYPYDGGFQIKDTLLYSLVETDVLVQTPAGSFWCYVYKYSQKPADDVLEPWDYYFYYSPGVGLVWNVIRGQFDGAVNGEMILQRYHVL